MSGVFGCSAGDTEACLRAVYYGTDYHLHLGAAQAGMAFLLGKGYFISAIHNITNGAHFKDLFEAEVDAIARKSASSERVVRFGIGVISDRDPQPLQYSTRFGDVAIVTVGRIPNLKDLAAELKVTASLAVRDNGKVNIAEVVIRLMEKQADLVAGLKYMWSRISGSISLLMIFADGKIVGARDRYGVSTLALGQFEDGNRCFASEICSFYNLGVKKHRFLKPGEIVEVTQSRETVLSPGCQKNCRACAFNWIYTGFPASGYEGIAVEPVRYRCGAAMARGDDVQVDMVAGIPDSGTGHAIGYSQASGIPYGRPYLKYTPGWSRSYIPDVQIVRDQIAQMKLLPCPELIQGKRLLFCEDSIVRGTQLRMRTDDLYELGAKEVHVRPACPPLMWPCPYLRSTRAFDELAARRAIYELEGSRIEDVSAYLDPTSSQYASMLVKIGQYVRATTLKYLQLDDIIAAIGLPPDQLCTYCWTGVPIERNGLIED